MKIIDLFVTLKNKIGVMGCEKDIGSKQNGYLPRINTLK